MINAHTANTGRVLLSQKRRDIILRRKLKKSAQGFLFKEKVAIFVP